MSAFEPEFWEIVAWKTACLVAAFNTGSPWAVKAATEP